MNNLILLNLCLPLNSFTGSRPRNNLNPEPYTLNPKPYLQDRGQGTTCRGAGRAGGGAAWDKPYAAGLVQGSGFRVQGLWFSLGAGRAGGGAAWDQLLLAVTCTWLARDWLLLVVTVHVDCYYLCSRDLHVTGYFFYSLRLENMFCWLLLLTGTREHVLPTPSSHCDCTE